MPRKTSSPIPRYVQIYPDHLATDEQLKAQGLKPGRTEPTALLEYKRGDVSGTCGLFARAEALPILPSPEGP